MSSILLVLNVKFNPQESLERMSATLYNSEACFEMGVCVAFTV